VTQQRAPETRDTAEQREPASETEPQTTADRPLDTRDLRDAQTNSRTATPSEDRPGIRAEGQSAVAQDPDAPLFEDAVATKLRERWMSIQTEFVDEPRGAVQKADSLVAEVLKQLTDSFARERDELEAGWSDRGDDADRDASTEELRQAIQRYRSFFNRLLSI
jgi:hypothetical protein